MNRLLVLTGCSLCLAAAIFFFKKRSPSTIRTGQGLVIPAAWLVVNNDPLTPRKDVRAADQTFLTFPEWYLVFSPEEQAAYFKHHTATGFPFMRHTAQIWESYHIVNDQIKDHFPPNTGYHFMIWVIGTSASVEYSIKACYETVVGRVTDTKQPVTSEDQFNAAFTQAYVDFIKDRPWYEFDFKSRLNTLWKGVPFWGDHILRKIERRYILSSELLVKWGYGKLIGLGTKTVYEDALPTTAVVLDSLCQASDSFKVSKQYPDKSVLAYLPRYDRFNQAITGLANAGCGLKEIAGNNSAILLSAIVPANNEVFVGEVKTVFKQPIAADPGLERVVLAVPVSQLPALLKQLTGRKIKIEHVFDY